MNIPEGWKLVPVEPEQQMVERGAQSIEDNGGNARQWYVREAWAEMLDAAPTPPAPVSMPEPLTNAEIDAARYRLLRRKFAIISDGNGNAEFCPISLPRPTHIAPNTAIELDTALDRERLGMDGAELEPDDAR